MIEKLAVNKQREWPEPKDGEPRLHIKEQPAPVVTFYRDGIEAAAKWIDKQREAYDSEHGWSDPDTGSFEFGNDAQRDYSSTLEELAEGIRALHPNAGNSPVIPEGYVMVPKEPTDEMIAAAMNCDDVLFNSDDSFCVQFGNIYEAMLAAAPQEDINALIPLVSRNGRGGDRWIPVSEQMPEDEQEVLTINKMGHRFVSFFDKHSGLFFDRLDAPAACCIERVLVTHWMPLPAAPQEVNRE
ncbi:TPA: DUF550 domain-containing protein [Klebsiella pneumoniae]|nr:DUF550 domain-containing protein [Klebsiella pneumoniae]